MRGERRAVVAASRRWAIASSAGLLFPGAGVGYLRWGRSPAGAAADGAVGNICLEHGLPVYLYQHSNGRRHPPRCSQPGTVTGTLLLVPRYGAVSHTTRSAIDSTGISYGGARPQTHNFSKAAAGGVRSAAGRVVGRICSSVEQGSPVAPGSEPRAP